MSTTWDVGTALGELFSSMMLIFFIMSITSITKNNVGHDKKGIWSIRQPALYALAGLASIFIGKATGNLFSSHGNLNGDSGLGLTTPLFALLVAFDFNAFDALPMIIGFQVIGSILGVILFIIFGFSLNLKNENKEAIRNGLILNNKNSISVGISESLAQAILSIFIMLLSSMGSEVLGANTYTNTFVLVAALFVILVIFSNSGYFILSPFINLWSLIIGHYYKITTKKHWINFTIQFSTHILIGSLIGGMDNLIRYPL